MAMWLTQERAQPGPVFGSKDYFTGLGIIIDTFANSRHVCESSPFVSWDLADRLTCRTDRPTASLG